MAMVSGIQRNDIAQVAISYIDGFFIAASDHDLAEFTLNCGDNQVMTQAIEETADLFNLPETCKVEIKAEVLKVKDSIAAAAGWDKERAFNALSGMS